MIPDVKRPNNRDSKYMKLKLLEMKGELDKIHNYSSRLQHSPPND